MPTTSSSARELQKRGSGAILSGLSLVRIRKSLYTFTGKIRISHNLHLHKHSPHTHTRMHTHQSHIVKVRVLLPHRVELYHNRGSLLPGCSCCIHSKGLVSSAVARGLNQPRIHYYTWQVKPPSRGYSRPQWIKNPALAW